MSSEEKPIVPVFDPKKVVTIRIALPPRKPRREKS